ncbi:MAG: periplasmic heavy metal sensor [Phycisphaeraceae bacterium]|nr:periplasmic heavy metal sensor [Phycisphaeraceae bacterium]
MNRTPKTLLIAATATAFLAFAIPSLAQTQPATPPATHPATPPAGVDAATHAAHLKQATAGPAAGTQPGAASDANAELVNQIAALRAEVAKLQAALMQGHTAQPPAGASAGMAMGGKGKMQKPMGSGQMKPMRPIQPQAAPAAGGMAPMPASGGMGMMDMDDKMEMGGLGGGAAGGGMSMDGMMQKMDGMMKMMGMGSMPMGGAGSPAAMAMPSALPGFPGASHIYHIGATGFFLDHPEHITLTLEQQTALSQKKEQALLQQAQFQRRVEEAEQELWVLTAADQPDAAAIDTKVQQIAKLQGEQRIAFIRAAGEAAKVLTDEQRKQLTGMLPPVPTPMAPAAPAMPAGGGMSDM